MSSKSKIYHLTLLTSVLAYMSNTFVGNIPYVVTDAPIQEFHFLPKFFIDTSVTILFFQHLGTFIGAIVFSTFVDKKGRLFILFLSVFIYSFATFLSGIVDNYYQFLVLKFIIGFGLAPELGIGIVLVSEIYSPKKRSLVVALIGAVGFMAVIALSFLVKVVSWRDLYIGVGLGGLLIMLLRFSTFESDLFLKIKKEKTKETSFKSIVFNKTFLFLLLCVFPIYVLTAISTFTVFELSENYHLITERATLAKFFAGGIILGFVAMPLLSTFLKSRKVIIQICLISLLSLSIFLCLLSVFKPKELIYLEFFYFLITCFGFFGGYLFEFFIFALEQFGTNTRASSAMLLFSFGRTSVLVFSYFISKTNALVFKNYTYTLFVTEMIVFGMAFWAISNLKETYNRDLDFVD
jgi:MFS transporter, putative metabolite:H+ symporter